jgi:hypothetical protein
MFSEVETSPHRMELSVRAVTTATNATDKYRAKAFELLSLTERAGDPAQRADLLRFALMWLTLTKPLEDLPPPKLPHEI